MAKKKIDIPALVPEVIDETAVESIDVEVIESVVDAAPEPVEVRGAFVYLGPTVPNSRLVCNRAYTGTLTEIRQYLSDQLVAFPGAVDLIVPVSDMVDFYHRVRQPGTALYQAYRDLSNNIKNR